MKKVMKLFVYVAAAAMALASCQKNEIDGPVKKDVHFTIKAGISDTKTNITDNGDGTYTPSWTVGDMIGVMFELGNGENKDTEFTAKTVENGVATFEGKYTFATNDEGSVDGQLYAFYPSAAFNKSYSDGEVRLDLKAVQKPTSSSFDPSCDLLIAKPCDYIAEATGDQTEVVIDNMYFARMMSVLRINLKSEFLSNETVKSVSFNAEGMHLTGAMRFNLAEGTFKGNQTTSGNSEVKAEYSDDPVAVAGEKNSVYLVVAPVTIPSGTTLTFTIETENYDIVKTVTAPSEKVLPVGNVAVINLNIAEENCTAKTEDTSDYSGTYAILAERTTGGYWCMTNDLGTASTKRFTAEEAGEALPEDGVALGASKLWQVSKSGEGYVVKSVGADQYITWTSGNSANLGNEGIVFTIGTNDDGTFQLSFNSGSEMRYLSLNNQSGNDYFAMYSSNQVRNLNLIPAVQGEEPSVLTATAPSQMSAEGGNGSFTYELKNPKDGVQLNATTEAAWITSVTVGDGEVTYTVTANESEEAREAVITLTYGDLTEDVTITQAGKPAEGGEADVEVWSWAGGGKNEFTGGNIEKTYGLGSDYDVRHAPYQIKMDGTGDYFIIKVDGAIKSVSVGVKMIGGGNTSTLDVQGSSDGGSYSSVEELTISGSQNDILELQTTKQFDPSYRYLKFNFTKGSNVGVGPITITYIPDNEGGSGGEEPEPDPTPDPEEPEEPEEPSEPIVATIAEFLAAEKSDVIYYQLTGIITNIASSDWGNLTIKDASESVYIYGLTKEQKTSNDKSFSSLGLKVGDQVTLITVRGEHNGTPQGGGTNTPAYYVSHIPSCVAPTISCVDNKVTIEAEVGATVYYTTNGTTPTVSSTTYTAPFDITSTVTVKAIAVAPEKMQSSVAEQSCTYVDLNAGEGDTPSEPITITLDLSKNLFNLSTSKANDASSEVSKTYEGYTYKFKASESFYYFGSKAMFLGKKDSYITFPAISGYKLASVQAHNCSGASSKGTIVICGTSNSTAVSGGTASTILAGGSTTWTLSSTAANTSYRFYITNANAVQLTKLVLTYQPAN